MLLLLLLFSSHIFIRIKSIQFIPPEYTETRRRHIIQENTLLVQIKQIYIHGNLTIRNFTPLYSPAINLLSLTTEPQQSSVSQVLVIKEYQEIRELNILFLLQVIQLIEKNILPKDFMHCTIIISISKPHDISKCIKITTAI